MCLGCFDGGRVGPNTPLIAAPQCSGANARPLNDRPSQTTPLHAHPARDPAPRALLPAVCHPVAVMSTRDYRDHDAWLSVESTTTTTPFFNSLIADKDRPLPHGVHCICAPCHVSLSAFGPSPAFVIPRGRDVHPCEPTPPPTDLAGSSLLGESTTNMFRR